MQIDPVVWGAAVLLALVAYVVWQHRRVSRRRASLRKEPSPDGGYMYVWTEFNGSEARARVHPEQPGGAWCADGDSADSDSGDCGD